MTRKAKYKITVINGYDEKIEIMAREYSIDEYGISILPFDATSYTDTIDYCRYEMQCGIEPSLYLSSVKIEEL